MQVLYLERERDVGGDLLAGGARAAEALDVQQQHARQAVQAQVLGSRRALAAHLALERLVALRGVIT